MRWLWLLAAPILPREAAAAKQSVQSAQHRKTQHRKTEEYVALEFQTWFFEFGGQAKGVEIFHSEEHGYGARATREISEGDEMIMVPKEMIFSRSVALDKKSSEARGYSPDIRNALARVTYDEDLVALLLLRERAMGESSFFAPYMKILPQRAMPLPSMLPSERAKEMLDDPSYYRAKTAAKRRSDRFRRIRDQVRVVLRGLPHEKEMSTLEAFVWADSIVDSRAITLAKEGKFVIPFADMFNYAPNPKAREHNQAKFFEQNHRMIGNVFMVVADRHTPRGQQVFDDYGDNDSELYLHAFGFIPAENPFDCVTVRLPAPEVKSQQRPLVRKLRVSKDPEGCLRPSQPMPDQILYHLHMLSMSEEAAAACLARMTKNPDEGALSCFDASYTIESAWTKLQEIISMQLGQVKTPTRPFVEDDADPHPLMPRLSEVQAVIDIYTAWRDRKARILLESPPPPAAKDQQRASAVDKTAADKNTDVVLQLQGLISETTQKYLGALRAANRKTQGGNQPWPEPIRGTLLELRGEVRKILENPTGDCSGAGGVEPEVR